MINIYPKYLCYGDNILKNYSYNIDTDDARNLPYKLAHYGNILKNKKVHGKQKKTLENVYTHTSPTS